MDSNLPDYLMNNWEAILPIAVAIIGFIISAYNKSLKEAEKKQKSAPVKKQKQGFAEKMVAAAQKAQEYPMTKAKGEPRQKAKPHPSKRAASAGQDVSLTEINRQAKREAYQEMKRLKKEASVTADFDYRKRRQQVQKKKRIRGKLQQAVIMKEVLDKPVSLRK
ncbi:hypothetical protein [Listeria costaricensis]|uniref:hypothetical protein n=1 Tax=Listeria costaricensis TaxID=2026604 RepID=UPI000C08BE40|nr:hypothetical protein [Listeria costaricensis]